jgi:CelD/BcsL family acetyltransferase involved in cellulose biosynthesis
MATSRVEIVPPAGLEALEGEWTELWRRCGASPFGHPAWLLPWARHYAPGRCGAALVREEGRLVALAAVFVWEGALLLAGTGPSDRGEPLMLRPDLAPALLAALEVAAPEPFQRIDLQQLDAARPLPTAAAPPGWSSETKEGDPCLVAPLTGEDGLGGLSSRRRENWRYAVRRLEREGARLSLAEGGAVPEAVEDLLRLHALRWQARGEEGVLADRLLVAHLRDAAPALDRAGLLRLHQLHLGGERLAVLLAIAGPWAHHYWIGGFDPTFARLSPSSTLIGAAMAQAHREGAGAFDFLRGEEPYKAHWGALPVPLRRLLLRRVDEAGR